MLLLPMCKHKRTSQTCQAHATPLGASTGKYSCVPVGLSAVYPLAHQVRSDGAGGLTNAVGVRTVITGNGTILKTSGRTVDGVVTPVCMSRHTLHRLVQRTGTCRLYHLP